MALSASFRKTVQLNFAVDLPHPQNNHCRECSLCVDWLLNWIFVVLGKSRYWASSLGYILAFLKFCFGVRSKPGPDIHPLCVDWISDP